CLRCCARANAVCTSAARFCAAPTGPSAAKREKKARKLRTRTLQPADTETISRRIPSNRTAIPLRVRDSSPNKNGSRLAGSRSDLLIHACLFLLLARSRAAIQVRRLLVGHAQIFMRIHWNVVYAHLEVEMRACCSS